MRCRTMLFMLAATGLLIAASGAGIKWNVPAGWKAQGDRPMRLATYTIAAGTGDAEGGECIVSYFGQGQGGSTEANLDRWAGQFLQADGKPNKSASKIANQTVHGLKVATMDVSGSYTGMGGPRGPQGAPKTGYRLLGAVVEGPQGSVFFKFTGPAKTVDQNRAQFNSLIASLSPE